QARAPPPLHRRPDGPDPRHPLAGTSRVRRRQARGCRRPRVPGRVAGALEHATPGEHRAAPMPRLLSGALRPLPPWVTPRTSSRLDSVQYEKESETPPPTPKEPTMKTVGEKFPEFSLPAVVSLERGKEFQDVTDKAHPGKWLVVFFWPMDFTFVCPTEIAAFGRRYQDFVDRDAQVLGVSTDTQYVHLAWRKDHEDLRDLP